MPAARGPVQKQLNAARGFGGFSIWGKDSATGGWKHPEAAFPTCPAAGWDLRCVPQHRFRAPRGAWASSEYGGLRGVGPEVKELQLKAPKPSSPVLPLPGHPRESCGVISPIVHSLR